MSDETARRLDAEVRAIIDRNYKRARAILQEKADVLHAMAEALVEYETLNREQIDDLMAGRPVRPTGEDRKGKGPHVKTGFEPEENSVGKGSGLGVSVAAN